MIRFVSYFFKVGVGIGFYGAWRNLAVVAAVTRVVNRYMSCRRRSDMPSTRVPASIIHIILETCFFVS